MDELLTQVGVGGIFAILVIREVFSFLEKRNGKKEGDQTLEGKLVSIGKENLSIAKEINDTVTKTHDMHDVRDGDGEFVWWTSSLRKHVADNTAAINKNTDAINSLAGKLDKID